MFGDTWQKVSLRSCATFIDVNSVDDVMDSVSLKGRASASWTYSPKFGWTLHVCVGQTIHQRKMDLLT
eukprot:540947-Amphidinium_carterae.1